MALLFPEVENDPIWSAGEKGVRRKPTSTFQKKGGMDEANVLFGNQDVPKGFENNGNALQPRWYWSVIDRFW